MIVPGPRRALADGLVEPVTLARAARAALAPEPGPSPSLPGAVAEGLTSQDGVVRQVLVPLLSVGVSVVVALAVSLLVAVLVGRAARRSEVVADLSQRARRPLRLVLVVVAARAALALSTQPADWRTAVLHVLLIAFIGALAWLLGSLAFVLEDAALARYRVDVADNRHARRVRTQVQVLRRITVAVLALCAIAAVLLTFPSARAVGASVFASAGLLSIVAGLAAQSSLANVFAGLQLAFTDAIRVDDVVIVEDEWGRIEEITLTYVVVHVWDDRRLILPSTYFTTTPFENWTRRASQLLGTVELDLDWDVPVDAMRARLVELLAQTPLWDQRVGILQVTEATGGLVRVRVLASAADAPTLFDLRCFLREGLVSWLQASAREALPRTRWEASGPLEGREGALARAGDEAGDTPGSRPDRAPDRARDRAPDRAHDRAPDRAPERVRTAASGAARREAVAASPGGPATGPHASTDSSLFTGSLAAVERSRHFTGPGEEVLARRERDAAGEDPTPSAVVPSTAPASSPPAVVPGGASGATPPGAGLPPDETRPGRARPDGARADEVRPDGARPDEGAAGPGVDPDRTQVLPRVPPEGLEPGSLRGRGE